MYAVSLSVQDANYYKTETLINVAFDLFSFSFLFLRTAAKPVVRLDTC